MRHRLRYSWHRHTVHLRKRVSSFLLSGSGELKLDADAIQCWRYRRWQYCVQRHPFRLLPHRRSRRHRQWDGGDECGVGGWECADWGGADGGNQYHSDQRRLGVHEHQWPESASVHQQRIIYAAILEVCNWIHQFDKIRRQWCDR